MGVVILALGVAHYDTYFQLVRMKSAPFQDWQSTTNGAIATTRETGGSIWYYHGNDLAERTWGHEAYGFYLPEGTPIDRVQPTTFDLLNPGDVIFFGDFACEVKDGALNNAATRMLNDGGLAYDVYLPRQFTACSTGYLTITQPLAENAQ